MAELLSVGLDVGTTSTQMVVSRLAVSNRASGFAVPELTIARREILYQSPVYFTPLLEEKRMDAQALRQIVEREYRAAGISREKVDTGAIIVTGETSRKENAAAVLEALADRLHLQIVNVAELQVNLEAVGLIEKELAEKNNLLPVKVEQEVMTLDNDWHVYFGGVQDTPESIEMPTLRSLTESDDAQIRYFSGTAVYTRDFDVKGYNKRATYRLDLGGVGCMAEVYLNGQMLGTLWKAPYAIDITPALKKKGNKLEVRVTNLWANRVIGDKQPDKKKRYAWASYNNAFRASSKPLPAGLLGGVRLLCTPAGK